MRPDASMQSLAALKPSFVRWAMGGFDAVAVQKHRKSSPSTTSTTPAILRASSTAPQLYCSATVRWEEGRSEAARPIRAFANIGSSRPSC
jgi:hypothetical protein